MLRVYFSDGHLDSCIDDLPPLGFGIQPHVVVNAQESGWRSAVDHLEVLALVCDASWRPGLGALDALVSGWRGKVMLDSMSPACVASLKETAIP